MKIAIIGTGHLGESIAKGLITTEAITSLYLTKRNLEDIKSFEGYKNVIISSNNIEAVKQSDILIFAVQPGHFKDILKTIKSYLNENHVLISAITGFSIPKIEDQQMFLFNLDINNIAASAGSACTSGSDSGSHVLKEIKTEKGYVNVRFSFSKYNSVDEVDYVVNKIEEIRSF